MVKMIADSAWQLMLNSVTGATVVDVCSSAPSTVSEIQSVSLGRKNITIPTIAVPSGARKTVSLPAVNNIPVSKSGRALVAVFSTASEIRLATDIAPSDITQGGTANLGSVELGMEVV